MSHIFTVAELRWNLSVWHAICITNDDLSAFFICITSSCPLLLLFYIHVALLGYGIFKSNVHASWQPLLLYLLVQCYAYNWSSYFLLQKNETCYGVLFGDIGYVLYNLLCISFANIYCALYQLRLTFRGSDHSWLKC